MTTKTRTILLAAVLATPLAIFGSPRTAMAQYRIDNGGALDANNRIGSGGTNEGRPANTLNGNDIVTGNVTGGREFRGNVPYSAPGAFHGNSAGVSTDRFISQSSSAYDQNAQGARPFYGQSYNAPPPAGFVQSPVPGQGNTYIQAPPMMRAPGDLRLGSIADTNSSELPKIGDSTLPGQVNTGNATSLLTASPLYGIRQDDPSAMSDGGSTQARYSNISRSGLQDRFGADDKSIQGMRDELNKNIVSDDAKDANGKPIVDPNDLSAKSRLGAPGESPVTTDLAAKPLNAPLTGTAFAGAIARDQSTTNALVPPPAEQSDQYKELRKRFDTLQPGEKTDQQVNGTFNKQFKDRQAANQKNAAKTGQPAGGMPGGSGGSGPLVPAGSGSSTNTTPTATPPTTAVQPKNPGGDIVKLPDQPPTPSPTTPKPADNTADKGPSIDTSSGLVKPGQPLAVISLTTGMKPSGLRDTLGNAEEEMRKGKYTSALDQYDLAERVAPNNPMITLGRAHAELGASYYARADADIRRALAADGALMLGQYNLSQFLGRDRMDFLEKDLKDITTTEPKSVRAPFLLAYIKYNAGDSKMASNYLALSEKRAGKADPLYKQLRVYWDLPQADAIPDAPEMNK